MTGNKGKTTKKARKPSEKRKPTSLSAQAGRQGKKPRKAQAPQAKKKPEPSGPPNPQEPASDTPARSEDESHTAKRKHVLDRAEQYHKLKGRPGALFFVFRYWKSALTGLRPGLCNRDHVTGFMESVRCEFISQFRSSDREYATRLMKCLPRDFEPLNDYMLLAAEDYGLPTEPLARLGDHVKTVREGTFSTRCELAEVLGEKTDPVLAATRAEAEASKLLDEVWEIAESLERKLALERGKAKADTREMTTKQSGAPASAAEEESHRIGYSSSKQLAQKYKLPTEIARKRLTRWRGRNKGSEDFLEHDMRRKNTPRFFYNEACTAIQRILKEPVRRRTKRPTKRPTKK